MTRDPFIYIHDILEAIRNIEEDTQGLSEEEFSETRIVQQATVRNLEIIGEAAQQLQQEFKDSHPAVPWRKIIAMRNRIIHEYFGLKLDVIWETIKEDLPGLKQKLQEVLKKEEKHV